MSVRHHGQPSGGTMGSVECPSLQSQLVSIHRGSIAIRGQVLITKGPAHPSVSSSKEFPEPVQIRQPGKDLVPTRRPLGHQFPLAEAFLLLGLIVFRCPLFLVASKDVLAISIESALTFQGFS
jgi:hypothetical protein